MENFIKSLENTITEGTSKIRNTFLSASKIISGDDEKEYFKSLVGKHFVIVREKSKAYYGEIVEVVNGKGRVSLNQYTMDLRYTFTVNFKKNGLIKSCYINPIRQKVFYFDSAEKAIEFCKKD